MCRRLLVSRGLGPRKGSSVYWLLLRNLLRKLLQRRLWHMLLLREGYLLRLLRKLML